MFLKNMCLHLIPNIIMNYVYYIVFTVELSSDSIGILSVVNFALNVITG